MAATLLAAASVGLSENHAVAQPNSNDQLQSAVRLRSLETRLAQLEALPELNDSHVEALDQIYYDLRPLVAEPFEAELGSLMFQARYRLLEMKRIPEPGPTTRRWDCARSYVWIMHRAGNADANAAANDAKLVDLLARLDAVPGVREDIETLEPLVTNLLSTVAKFKDSSASKTERGDAALRLGREFSDTGTLGAVAANYSIADKYIDEAIKLDNAEAMYLKAMSAETDEEYNRLIDRSAELGFENAIIQKVYNYDWADADQAKQAEELLKSLCEKNSGEGYAILARFKLARGSTDLAEINRLCKSAIDLGFDARSVYDQVGQALSALPEFPVDKVLEICAAAPEDIAPSVAFQFAPYQIKPENHRAILTWAGERGSPEALSGLIDRAYETDPVDYELARWAHARLVEQGDINSMVDLAVYDLFGLGADPSQEKYRQGLTKVPADQKPQAGDRILAWVKYADDTATQFTLIADAEKFGSANAITIAALALFDENKPAEAIAKMKKASEADSYLAHIYMAAIYASGIEPAEKDEAAGETYFEKALQVNGEATSAFEVGNALKLFNKHEEAFRFYQRASELGLGEATIEVGVMQIEGKGVEKSIEAGVATLQPLADNGDPKAIREIAIALSDDAFGWDAKGDKQRALTWIKKWAESGDPQGMTWLSRQLLNTEEKLTASMIEESVDWWIKGVQATGEPIDKASPLGNNGSGYEYLHDKPEGITWLKRAVEQVPEIWNVLGARFAREGKPQDSLNAFKSAQTADVFSGSSLASAFSDSKSLKPFEDQVLVILKESDDYFSACFSIARRYQAEAELATPPNDQSYQRARVWAERSASGGEANWLLAELLAMGLGGPADEARALTMIKDWKEAPDICYDYSKKIESRALLNPGGDFASAARWMQRAQDLGQPEAKYELARMKFRGRGVPEDRDGGFQTLTQGATENNPLALRLLANEYLVGAKVPRDLKKYIELLERAAKAGDEPAGYTLSLYAEIEPAALNLSDEMLNTWYGWESPEADSSDRSNRIVDLSLETDEAKAIKMLQSETQADPEVSAVIFNTFMK